MTIKNQGKKTQKQLKRILPKSEYDGLIKGIPKPSRETGKRKNY